MKSPAFLYMREPDPGIELTSPCLEYDKGFLSPQTLLVIVKISLRERKLYEESLRFKFVDVRCSSRLLLNL